MKIRTGFVSNSSSSSFVCDITGEAFEVYDSSLLSEYDAVQCVNGHVFLYYTFPEIKKWVEDALHIDQDEDTDEEAQLPADMCPLCQGDPRAKNVLVKRILQMMRQSNVTIVDLTEGAKNER